MTFSVTLVQQTVQGNECPCSANTSTATSTLAKGLILQITTNTTSQIRLTNFDECNCQRFREKRSSTLWIVFVLHLLLWSFIFCSVYRIWNILSCIVANVAKVHVTNVTLCHCYFTTSNLQWTTIGPVLWSSNERMRRRKASSGYVYSGTCLFDHDMNWKWNTDRLSPYTEQTENL